MSEYCDRCGDHISEDNKRLCPPCEESFGGPDTISAAEMEALKTVLSAASLPVVFEPGTGRPMYQIHVHRQTLCDEILDQAVHLKRGGFTPTGIVIQDQFYYQLILERRRLEGGGRENDPDAPLTFSGLPLLIVDNGHLTRPFIVTRSRPR